MVPEKPGAFQQAAASAAGPNAVYIADLQAERAHLVLYGKAARVEAVDAELRRLGAVPPAVAPPAAETATSTTPVETAGGSRPGRARRS